METIIIAIGAVVVIGIAAFFVLKKLQAQKSELPANPQAHIPAQQTSVAPTPTATSNDLATAEAHIRNQNYNEAIAELKRILMTNPRHNGAMLKLLQTYGVTKQFAAFNQLHQKIHEIADGETIREADFCKSLLEEEMSSAAIQTPAPTQTVTMTTPADAVAVAPQSEPSNSLDSGLDFEFETPEPTLATPNDNINELDFDFDTPQIPTPSAKSAVENNDFDLSFDVPSQETQPIAKPALEEPTLDFDDFSFDEPSSTPPANEPTLDFDMLDDDFNQGLGGALDIGLGGELNSDLSADFDTKPAPNTVAQTAPTPNSDELDAFDFNFDAPTPAPVPSASPVNSDDLGFDFDLTPEPVATPVTTTPANDLALDGFDFDADLSSPAQPTTPSPTPVSQADMSDLGGFDLSFDTQTTPAAPTPQTNADNGLGFDGLDADFGLVSEPEPAIKPAPTPATPSADFADFDLGLDSTPTPKPTPANTNDNLSFDNLDLGLDTQTAQPTPSKATTPTQDTALAFDANELAFDATSITETNDLSFSGFDFAETPAVTAPMSSPKVAPSAQPVTTASPVSKQPTQTAGVPSELSFVDNLDNTGVTLNLAKQYLDLGEYDSAKRLLDEVIQTGNATQQQNARELLTQLV